MRVTWTFANFITIVRILAVPFFISVVLYYSPQKDYIRWMALAIFFFAVLTDVIDGYIARRQHQRSQAGAVLDPLADKLLLMSAFISLYKVGVGFSVIRLPMWLVVAVISRDTILLLGSMLLYLLKGRLDILPTIWGKATTFFQTVIVFGILLQWQFTEIFWYVTLILTVISGIDYIRKGLKELNNGL